jgi:hypothetical protein
MKSSIAACAVLATLSSCQQPPSSPDTPATASPSDQSRAVCERLKSASEAGDDSLRLALQSSAAGQSYSKGLDETLVRRKNYSFWKGRWSRGTCWAYAEAHTRRQGKASDLRWACPLKVYSGDISISGQTVVELVDDRSCVFGTVPGLDPLPVVKVELIKL